MQLFHDVDTEAETSGRHKHGKELAVFQHVSRVGPTPSGILDGLAVRVTPV